jgi:DNA-binding GntR family transcriptional regulator
MAREIDRWSEVTYYEQLASILRDQIQRGEFEPGQGIPSETTLMQAHSLSRGTVRRAIEMLAQDGYLETVARRGSRVRPREDWPEDGNGQQGGS